MDIVAVGDDNAVWQKSWTATGGWGAWSTLGGVAASDASIISWQGGRLDAFVLGTDGQPWQITRYPGQSWGSWHGIGGSLSASIRVASPNDSRLDLISRDTANQPVMRTWTADAGWSPWYVIGGATVSSGVSGLWWGGSSASSGQRFDVFARGPSDGVYQNTLFAPSYANWYGWNNLGGGVASGVAAASPNPTRLDVAVRGTDQAIWLKTWLSGAGGWQPWSSLGGSMSYGPTLTWWKSSDGSDRLDIWSRDTSNNLEQKTWTPAGWTDWVKFDPPEIPEPDVGTLTLGPIDDADGSDGDAQAAGYPGRGCRRTHDYNNWKRGFGHTSMDTRFCWNEDKKKAVWDAQSTTASPLLDMDSYVSTAYALAGYSIHQDNNRIYRQISWGGSSTGAIYMETDFDIHYCPVNVPLGCTAQPYRYVPIGYYDGHATAYIQKR